MARPAMTSGTTMAMIAPLLIVEGGPSDVADVAAEFVGLTDVADGDVEGVVDALDASGALVESSMRQNGAVVVEVEQLNPNGQHWLPQAGRPNVRLAE